jgi:hypothetical protein
MTKVNKGQCLRVSHETHYLAKQAAINERMTLIAWIERLILKEVKGVKK